MALGFALSTAARVLRVEGEPLVDDIYALLPGSQCGQCGFPGCAAAAEAVASGDAPITLCPPGGSGLVEALSVLTGKTVDLAGLSTPAPTVAVLHEHLCTGCTRCFKTCPTDAIVGAPNQLHGVISDACIGCGKCAALCPTEAVEMRPIPVTLRTWYWPRPVAA